MNILGFTIYSPKTAGEFDAAITEVVTANHIIQDFIDYFGVDVPEALLKMTSKLDHSVGRLSQYASTD